MVEFGRLSLSDAGLADVLTELEQGNFYERLLALQSCHGSRNGAMVFRALADPSTRIRAYAFTLVALFCNQEQQRQALLMVPVELRLPLLRSLRQHHLQDPVDAFLRELARQEDPYLGRYLAFGSPELIERYLPQTYQRFNRVQWRRLARWQPDLTLSLFRQRLSTADELDEQVLIHFNSVIPILALSRPDALLELLRSAVPGEYITQLKLDALGHQRPDQLFDLLITLPGANLSASTIVPVRLTGERLRLLFQRQWVYIEDNDWLKRVPVQERVLLFQDRLGRSERHRFVSENILKALPWQYSRQEAQRIWSLSDLSLSQMKQRTQYARFLPWQEAMEHLQYDLQHADAHLRGRALALLANSVSYQREHLSDLLSLFLLHRNEPDTARWQLLYALGDLPPGIWQAAHLPVLGAFIQASLAASDLSTTSVEGLRNLLIQLLPFHRQWIAEQLVMIMQARGEWPTPHYYGEHTQIEECWSREDVQCTAPLFLSILEQWLQQDKLTALIACAWQFGFHLRHFDDLAQLLVQALPKVRNNSEAYDLLSRLFKWRPDLIAEHLPGLLQQDPSWILIQGVRPYLQRCRQDLLTPFLDRSTIQGCFSPVETAFQLELEAAYLLTRTQQERFARHLEQSLSGQNFDYRHIKETTRQLAAVPSVLPERLLAHMQRSSDYKRWAFIDGLAIVDSADVAVELFVSLLHTQLQEDTGNSIVQSILRAFRRAIRQLPAARAFQVLSTQNFARLMVQKELIYWLGELPLSEAYWYLMQQLDKQDLHPDLRAAVIRALWSHLDRPETWEVLAREAREASSGMASKIGRISPEQLMPAEHEQLLRLLQTLLQHPILEVRIELLEQMVRLPILDPGRIVTPTLLTIIQRQSLAEAQAAAPAFMTICTDRDIPELQASMHMLCQDYQRLSALLPCFYVQPADRRHRVAPKTRKKFTRKLAVNRALLEVPAHYPLTTMLRLRSSFKLLPIADIIQLLEQLAASNQLHAEAMMVACNLLKRRNSQRITHEDLAAIESALARHPDERLRRIALEAMILIDSKDDYAGTRERSELLQAFQADPSPMVAEAALAITV